MIEVYELLRKKENDLARVRREIEALRTVTALLAEPDDISDLQPGPDPNVSPLPLDASPRRWDQEGTFVNSRPGS